MRAMAFALLLIALGQGARTLVTLRVLPVDEATRDPTLVVARQRVIDALKARDANAIRAAMHPDVALEANAHGRENAILLFPSEDMDQLLRVLQLGGSFRNTPGELVSQTFCAPYAMSKFPTRDELPLVFQPEAEPGVILGADVPMYQEDNVSSAVVGRLSHEVVIARAFRTDFVLVGTTVKPRGAGWVDRHQLWIKADDFFACFGKFNGQWLMTEFSRDPIGF